MFAFENGSPTKVNVQEIRFVCGRPNQLKIGDIRWLENERKKEKKGVVQKVSAINNKYTYSKPK